MSRPLSYFKDRPLHFSALWNENREGNYVTDSNAEAKRVFQSPKKTSRNILMALYDRDLIRLLIVAHLDIGSVTSLAKQLVQSSPQYDCIVAIGPFIHDSSDGPADDSLNTSDGVNLKSLEEQAMAQADIAAVLAQLENIVCRVIYLTAESDPHATLTEQLNLTPNSVNIHGRKLSLVDSLYVAGFTERSENVNTYDIDELSDTEEDGYTQLDRNRDKASDSKINVQPRKTTVEVIEELFLSEFSPEQNFDELTIQKYKETNPNPLEKSNTHPTFGIFVFNYKYAHSLSYFLFHMGGTVESAGIQLCIIPPGRSETLRLPTELGNLNIIVPKSLRRDRKCESVTLRRDSDGIWRKDASATIEVKDV